MAQPVITLTPTADELEWRDGLTAVRAQAPMPRTIAELENLCRCWGPVRLEQMVADDETWHALRGGQKVALVQTLLEYGFGRPTQRIEGSLTVQSSPEERMARIAALMEVAQQRMLADGNGSRSHEDSQEGVCSLQDGEGDAPK